MKKNEILNTSNNKILYSMISVLILMIILFLLYCFNEKNKINIIFVDNDNVEIIKVKKNSIIEEKKVNDENFVGWYNNDTKFDFENNISKNIVLTAKYLNKDYYSVIFDTDGGSSIESVVVKYNEKISIPATPEKKGFKFIRWEFEGLNYNFDSKLRKNIVLKAIWKVDEYNQLIEKLKNKISGKKISILGDSISSFKGYSNDYKNANNTIKNNLYWYNGENILNDVDQTWWMKTINKLDLNLLVNNSYSGDQITKLALSRSSQLHNNIKNIEFPDIIVIYMGVNDFNYNVSYDNFISKYEQIIKNIKNKYKESDVFLFNMIPNKKNNRSLAELEKWNDFIKNISGKYGCTLVDLYNNSEINNSNLNIYMSDEKMVHPNILGMEKISETFIKYLSQKYVE